MILSRLVLPAFMLAVLPAANMIATASSASGEPPKSQLAQMRGPAGPHAAQLGFAPFGPGGPPELPAHGRSPGFPPGPFGFGAPAGLRPSPRALCEGRIHVEAGMRAHLRSRLKLDPGQREAWARMEALVEPVDLRARELCAALPVEASAPPAAPDLLAFADRELGLRLEWLKLLQVPFRDFYQTLNPEQRAILDRPPAG